ncbi:hypothetical protein J2T38_000265 [Neisseria perflava]|uniref:hypothetical protein n=1 Tax=Neisseria perflava TaxID=33053 RepID=UPI0020A2000E|nr:hypothetical protein [Neisseria perflava]MCP1771468.1 hypothetical protein [Neisseria perflava]
MKPIVYQMILALGLGTVSLSAQAVSYICKVDGGIVYTDRKIGNHCTESHTDGTADIPTEEAEKAVPEKVNLKEAPGQAAPELSDIKILPRTQSGSVTATENPANPRLDIKLRNGKSPTAAGAATGAVDLKSAKERAAELNRKAKIIPAPVIAAPTAKPKPQLTRKQILQNEIRNEQAALARARAQLNVAKKKGDQAKIGRLTQAVKDREANIRAIQGEMSR